MKENYKYSRNKKLPFYWKLIKWIQNKRKITKYNILLMACKQVVSRLEGDTLTRYSIFFSYLVLHKTLIIVPPSEDKNKFYSNILPINIVIEIISNSKLNRPFSLFFIPSKKQEVKKCKIQK